MEAKKVKNLIGEYFSRMLLKGIGSLPLGMLHPVARFVGWLMHDVARYRRRIVMSNLRSAFPQKSEKELRKTAKAFYRFLGDYFVELARMSRMSREEMLSRMKFENIGELDADLRAGKNVTLCLGHYCNWEWVSSIPLHLTAKCRAGQIYHPLENGGVDRTFIDIRSRWGADCVPMMDTLRWIRHYRSEGIPTVMGYIADQVPLYDAVHCFVDFLNHDTPVFTGPERLSRMLHGPVYYLDMQCTGRGHYTGRFEKLCDDASKLEKFELTHLYFSRLEQSINRAPQYWLWSHNRWKRTREGFLRKYGEEEAAKRLSHP